MTWSKSGRFELIGSFYDTPEVHGFLLTATNAVKLWRCLECRVLVVQVDSETEPDECGGV